MTSMMMTMIIIMIIIIKMIIMIIFIWCLWFLLLAYKYEFAHGYHAPPWRQVHGDVVYLEVNHHDVMMITTKK
eukprot:UN06183